MLFQVKDQLGWVSFKQSFIESIPCLSVGRKAPSTQHWKWMICPLPVLSGQLRCSTSLFPWEKDRMACLRDESSSRFIPGFLAPPWTISTTNWSFHSSRPPDSPALLHVASPWHLLFPTLALVAVVDGPRWVLLFWVPTRQDPSPPFRMLPSGWTSSFSPRSHGWKENRARTNPESPTTHRDRVHARRIESEARGLPKAQQASHVRPRTSEAPSVRPDSVQVPRKRSRPKTVDSKGTIRRCGKAPKGEELGWMPHPQP